MRKGTESITKCPNCEKAFSFPSYLNRKFCSVKCNSSYHWRQSEYKERQAKAHEGESPKNLEKLIEFSKTRKNREAVSKRFLGATPWNKGVHQENISGTNNYLWKGDDVSYRALHKWVQNWLGTPEECEYCGKTGTGRQIHWANKSHKYKRELNDWLRLCAKCHKQYDSQGIGELLP